MDIIFIRELRLDAWIGLYRHEKIAPQTIQLDLEIALAGDKVFASGKVGDTIDYSVVVAEIRKVFEQERFGLVETLADRIAHMVIDTFAAPYVKVSVTKLGVLRDAKQVGVTIERKRASLATRRLRPPKP